MRSLEHDETEILEYMQQWVRSEGFCDLAAFLDAGDIELAANHLVANCGCIDSDTCYAEVKAIEKDIEALASEYNKQVKDHRQHIRRLDAALGDCLVVTCKSCNYVQFPSSTNFGIYEEELKANCWECDSNEIEVTPWNDED